MEHDVVFIVITVSSLTSVLTAFVPKSTLYKITELILIVSVSNMLQKTLLLDFWRFEIKKLER